MVMHLGLHPALLLLLCVDFLMLWKSTFLVKKTFDQVAWNVDLVAALGYLLIAGLNIWAVGPLMSVRYLPIRLIGIALLALGCMLVFVAICLFIKANKNKPISGELLDQFSTQYQALREKVSSITPVKVRWQDNQWICNQCQAKNQSDMDFCEFCGRPRIQQDISESMAGIEKSSRKPILCIYCGSANEETDRYCTQCGKDMWAKENNKPVESKTQASVFCPVCGEKSSEGLLFCNSCGAKLG